MPPLPSIRIDYPDWVGDFVDWERAYESDEERMRLAVALSRENVLRRTGGPFGAAIFESGSGRLVAVGMNLVVPLCNSTLHAEMVAFMMAQRRLCTYTLGGEEGPAHTLATSCEPCAMCLGATLWSGVKRVLTGATREDALAIKFEEGPVFASSYRYLRNRGIEFARGVCRGEAAEVLQMYMQSSGVIYNG